MAKVKSKGIRDIEVKKTSSEAERKKKKKPQAFSLWRAIRDLIEKKTETRIAADKAGS